jgi:hypothetical protein
LKAVPLVCGLLAGCALPTAVTYQGPAPSDQNAAVVAVGAVAEQYSVSQGGAWIQIVAVDGESTGPVQAVRVAPGEHRFTVRHFDGYALINGNITYDGISFQTEPGGHYRIDGAYCCGFILGRFDLFAYDESSGRQIAYLRPNPQ